MGASPEELRARVGTLEPVDCPICRRDHSELFAEDLFGFHIVRCAKCRLLYLNPRPSSGWLLDNIYVDEYHEALPAAGAPLVEPRQRRLSRQVDGIERLTSGRTVLDVGCGQGDFLEFAAGRGWKVFGTEISPTLVVRLQSHLPQGTFFCGRMGEIQFENVRFDAIRLNHVLEHTLDPAVELGHAAAVLADNGVVYVSVPNLDSLDSRLKTLLSRLRLKRNLYRHFSTLHHLWFFTPETMCRLAESVGLRVAALETPVYSDRARGRLAAVFDRAVLEPLRMGNCVDIALMKPANANR
jgi:2-polyprenyl-3-methyl-5-hydroxy-6-metoxy-1,4-benzoquinol methylase